MFSNKLLVLKTRLFDANTPRQRRLSRLLWNIVSAFAVRGMSILITLVTVPLTLNYLGAERYGIWLTISSLTSLFAFADLGIGNGLLNAISDSYGRDDVDKTRRYVASAFAILTAITLLIGVLFTAVYSFIDWPSLLNVQTPQAAREVGPSVFLFVICFLIGIPLGVIQRVQMGYQEAYINHVWTIIGRIVSLIALLLVISIHGGLELLVLALVGTPLIATILNGVHVFFFRHRTLLPRLTDVDFTYGRRLLKLGFLFFVLQIAGLIAYSSDNLVLVRLLGPEAVATYAVPVQLFNFSALLLSIGLNPLWPAYTEALARGDSQWVKTIFVRSVKISIAIALVVSVLLLLFGYDLLRLWVGTEIVPPLLLMIALAVWQMLTSLNGSFAMLLNGANVIRFQVICSLSMAVANLIFSIFLVQEVGISGVVWGSILAQTIFVLVPTAVYIPRLLKRIEQPRELVI